MIVDYYSVDVKPTKAILAEASHRAGLGQRYHRRTESTNNDQ